MRLGNALKLACLGLWANKFRVLSAMMGIVIGLFAVIVLIAIAVGVKDTLLKQMGSLGAEQILVMPGRVLDSANGQKDFLSGITSVPSTLTYEDAKAVEAVPNVKSVTPQLETVSNAAYGEQNVQAVLVGSTHQYNRVQHAALAEGRFFTEEEQQSKENVIVLGSNIHDALLGKTAEPRSGSIGTPAPEEKTWWQRALDSFMAGTVVSAEGTTLVGQKLTIGEKEYTVIGVLKPNATLGSSTDNNVIMPIETALANTDMKFLNKMIVEANSTDVIDEVDGAVFSAIKQNHKEIDFSVVKQDQMLGAIDNVTVILQVMLLGITAVALFISGTGIMNVMVMSVRERTREIGIRKAIGATTFEIMAQFFFETLLLCMIGGLFGIGLGYAFIELWNHYIEAFTLALPLWAIQLALGSTIVIGGLFGIYPALKAARMRPSHALRFE
ncbi:ABC transporter permease [Domibacillus sp. DTU_2020_1001157_1_SI_ALB_TIR_016]|uniref:ABC transporter permease n=1 Tax=Domibacillus sp. DTU_2020_1001157_1_SI_ALB_TIR_016 TaxID=3077789 RepID=UPI0028F129B6|nr:ABC transporter permease [Domibacillus sp. DTU_2020_1001157_1_SI_ALB_TIR_016]WNS81198.1 ABC transporter permease [Domibacillus sp. DTU_2020_1001157_1_SI_ALB_TIR_016]